ncbi:4'-phosphopantetheinyl transferase NpgA [Ascosphaera apis ARSEF 7405]|uniref:holo-[acyl-carrier-protein] synthase n=1 Tax=Ascosphaera apis ARSEF 7405 TaxID=392613 RepID=A0A167VWI3_9EURO|nr:4'-phosphopantetheinyl transferase NpgA [Ascosphaera apis ARSEF 7405]
MASPSDSPLEASIGPDILTRWYIDTRPFSTEDNALPLLSTLQSADQRAVKAFYHLCDRQMSLASCLLKYLFVHRSCKVPWKEIIIQRSPPPHRRPFYDSAALNWDGGAIEKGKEVVRVEFNGVRFRFQVMLKHRLWEDCCHHHLRSPSLESISPAPTTLHAVERPAQVRKTATSLKRRRIYSLSSIYSQKSFQAGRFRI